MQSSSTKPRRIHHTRAPSVSFSAFSFPSERSFPLYAHCNSQRSQRAPRNHCNSARIVPTRTRRQDLMQTVDYRSSEKLSRRSSFALSDIFELDEEEIQFEFEISPILPSTPTSTCSTATSRSVKSRMKTVLIDLAHTLKTKLNRSCPPKIYVVEPQPLTSTAKLECL